MSTSSVNLRYFILGLLNQHPMSGYDIKRFLKGLSWLVDSPSFGNIYPTLHALLEDGLTTVKVVSQQNKPPRKVYNITNVGRQALHEWASQPVAPTMSLKTFVMRLVLAGNFSQERLITHLKRRRDQVADRRSALERATDELGERAGLQRLALDYGLALAATELAWLDNTVNRLSQQPMSLDVVKGD
jgi:DNA-binding PadR family transcriptional regulator